MPRSDSEEGFPPPKRRSRLGVPRDDPKTLDMLTDAEIKRRMAAIRDHAREVLEDPLSEWRTGRLEGCEHEIRYVRFGRDWAERAIKMYFDHFRGPAVSLLPLDDITHVIAFWQPEWAKSTEDSDDNDDDPQQPRKILMGFRVHGGKLHYWAAWAMSEGTTKRMYKRRWGALMRSAVRPEIDEFYDAARASADREGRRVTCALCGCDEPPGQRMNVDHMGPAYYSRILLEFCRTRGWQREDNSIAVLINARPSRPGEARNFPCMPLVLETVPPTAAGDFAEYHRNFPKTLRLLCGTCNKAGPQRPPPSPFPYTVGGKVIINNPWPQPLAPVRSISYGPPVTIDFIESHVLPPAPPTSEQD
jgi:hypothetical protein